MFVLSVGGLLGTEIASAQESVEATAQVEQVDINSASIGELQKLSGIGAVLAQRIIDTRPFASIDELTKIKGIGAGTLNKIKD
ncbi:ComEA family DNA-binding protein, partial [Enterococcus silesiacus]